MTIRKRIYAVVLTAALILTLLPAFAFAEGEAPAKPVDAFYIGAPYGSVGDNTIEGLYTEGTSVFVESEGGSEKIYEYGNYKYKDENGVEQDISGFLETGADPSRLENYATVNIDYDHFSTLVEGANEVTLLISVPAGVDKDGQIQYADFQQKLRVWVRIDRPLSVKFVPADGFELKGTVGYNLLNEEDFYGEGNKFIVTIETRDDPMYISPAVGSIEAEYIYYKSEDGTVEGFYDNANPEYERFDMTEGVECFLKKGQNKDIELTYYAYVEGLDDPVPLNFNVDIDAEKYGLYADAKNSTYTGKVIKPNFTIYNTDDEAVPAEEYTFKAPASKKIGWYDFEATIKEAFRDKYDYDTVIVTYAIVPKAPVLSSLTAGKKSLKVKWKKLSSKNLKTVDGMYIELATDKDFTQDYKMIELSKKAVKSGKKTVKGLQKGKKYYVRMSAFKKVGDDEVISDNSKTKSKKTK